MLALLVQWLVSGLAIAFAAFIAMQFVPAGAAAERHRLWWAALLAVVALPFLPFAVSLLSSHAGAPGIGRGAAAGQETALVSLALPSWLTPLLTGAWAAWAFIVLARIGASVIALRRLVASSTEMDDVTLAEVAGRVRGATVWRAPGLRGACAVGFVRPRIIMGADVPMRLDAEALRLIVLHEAAHLARYDDWTRLVRQLIVAPSGFHPAVWFIARQIDHECESACDQWVVAHTGSPVRYARALVTVAEAAPKPDRDHRALAPGVLGRRSRLGQRVARLLTDTAVPRAVRLVRATVGAGLVGLAALLTALIPPIVALVGGPPLTEFASLPATVTLRSFVPVVESRRPVLPDAPRDTAQGLPRFDAGRAETVTPPPPMLDQASDTPAVDVGEPVERSVDVLPDAPRLVHTLVVSVENSAAAREGTSPGALAARAGMATGDAAARAGRSIGRFFTRGGRAVSNRF